MTEKVFHVGDEVKFSIVFRPVHGVVVEDRGPLGGGGRRLYGVELRPRPEPPAPYYLEIPADEMELVKKASTGRRRDRSDREPSHN